MTMTLIQTVTVGSNASNITISSIPGTYTDLLVNVSARSTSGLGIGNVAFNLAINGSTENKTFRRLYAGGNSTGSDTPSQPARGGSAVPTSAATSNTFGNVSYYFTNYSSSLSPKIISLDGTTENNSTSYEIDLAGLLWTSSAAITSLSFTNSDSSAFVAGSSISVYGITKGSGGATIS